MTKEFLNNIENLTKELDSLENRLKQIEEKEHITIADSVQASSSTFPYTKYSTVVYGVPYNPSLKNKYKKIIKIKKYKLEKAKLQLEYELNYIKDPQIREIIRYKYTDNLNWVQIMFKMGFNSESTAKMKLNRFFKKN